jgi:hypothetical protein
VWVSSLHCVRARVGVCVCVCVCVGLKEGKSKREGQSALVRQKLSRTNEEIPRRVQKRGGR